MNKCPKCNHQLKDNDLFCDECGARVIHQAITAKHTSKSEMIVVIIAAVVVPAICLFIYALYDSQKYSTSAAVVSTPKPKVSIKTPIPVPNSTPTPISIPYTWEKCKADGKDNRTCCAETGKDLKNCPEDEKSIADKVENFDFEWELNLSDDGKSYDALGNENLRSCSSINCSLVRAGSANGRVNVLNCTSDWCQVTLIDEGQQYEGFYYKEVIPDEVLEHL